MLKKAAVGGAVAWTAPAVLSTPAFAQTTSDVLGGQDPGTFPCTTVFRSFSFSSVDLGPFAFDSVEGDPNVRGQRREWYGIRVRAMVDVACVGTCTSSTAVLLPPQAGDFVLGPQTGWSGAESTWYVAAFGGAPRTPGGLPLPAGDILFRLRGEANGFELGGTGGTPINESEPSRTGPYTVQCTATARYQCPGGSPMARTTTFEITLENGAWSVRTV